jgi:hypothetical protein
MAEIHEERSVTTTTDGIVDDRVVADHRVVADPVRRGNPVPVIAAICIGLLIVFLVLFGMSRNNSGDGNHDGVRITVPTANNDGNGGNGGATDKP